MFFQNQRNVRLYDVYMDVSMSVCVRCTLHQNPKPAEAMRTPNQKKHKPFTFWGFKRAPCSDVHGKDALAIPQRCQAISDQRSRGWWSSSLGIVGWTQSSPQHISALTACLCLVFCCCCCWWRYCWSWCCVGIGVVHLTSHHPGTQSNVKLCRQFFMYGWSSATQILLIYFICVSCRKIVMWKSLKNRKFKFNLQGTSLESIEIEYWPASLLGLQFYPKNPRLFQPRSPK